jgi:hypothetical protein
MSFVSFPTDPNIMNDTQLSNLKSNYVEMILDGMDMKTMEALVYDMLIESYELYSEDEMKEEILSDYDEETLESLMPVDISELEATAPDYGVGK